MARGASGMQRTSSAREADAHGGEKAGRYRPPGRGEESCADQRERWAEHCSTEGGSDAKPGLGRATAGGTQFGANIFSVRMRLDWQDAAVVTETSGPMAAAGSMIDA
jgi:hypothetical protein